MAAKVSKVGFKSASGAENGTLNAGDVVTVAVDFSAAVWVTGQPQLWLKIGTSLVKASYAGGSGTTQLTFSYTIQAGQNDANGISLTANSLVLNGGTIKDAATGGTAAALTHAAVADNAQYKVDTTAPAVVSGLSLSGTGTGDGGALKAGDTVTVKVGFSEVVTVSGAPLVWLKVGGSLVQASYAAGSGTNQLSFTYTIVAGQVDTDGLSVTADSLRLNGGVIRDAAGNNAVLTHAAVADQAGLKVSAALPSTLELATDSGLVGDGLTNSATINVKGLAQGAGWQYQVDGGQWQTGSGNSFELSSGTHRYSVKPDGGSASAAEQFTLDQTGPTVTGVAIAGASGAQNGRLNAGDVVTVQVVFSEAVEVSGSPRVALKVGGQTVQASYAGGSGTEQLSFTYTVAAGQNDADGIAIDANALSLNGGAIKDIAGNVATLTHAGLADDAGYRVDTTGPTVTAVAISGANGAQNGYLNAGDAVLVTVDFTEAVTVSGAVQLGLDIGGTVVQASYLTGAGTNRLTFSYVIAQGQQDVDGIAVPANALALARGGAINDLAGNAATLTHASAAANAGYKVDTAGPVISSGTTAVAIAENSGAGQVVYQAIASDGGSGGVSYSLKAGVGDAAAFRINAQGAVMLTGNPDYEAKPNYAFTLVATDAAGNASEKAVTLAISNVNEAPTGSVAISGSARQGETLTAANTLVDDDGLGTITYQWKANGTAIGGATGSTLTLTEAQVGKAITVTASYTDGHGTAEAITSTATSAVANVNDAPTGGVTISGTATQGQTLTASNTLADADGLGTIAYQWYANGTAIGGATGSTLTLAEAQVGKAITVTASYTDGHGTAEAVTSSATTSVAALAADPAAVAYGLLHAVDTVTPIEARTAFYDGVGTLKLNTQWASYLQVADVSSNATTVIDTQNGALVGMGSYGKGRVAVVNSDYGLWKAMQEDPAQGGMARGFFNLFSWLANEQRTVGQQDQLHVLSGAGDMDANPGQSMFWEYLNDATSYQDPASLASGQISSGQFADYAASARLAEALTPGGTWSRNYDVVVLRSSALESEVQMVRQWMAETGGGVLVKYDGSTASAAVTQLLADVGLSGQKGPTLAGGDYSPIKVDPTATDFVRTELSGKATHDAGTAGKPIFVQSDLKLPTEILGGTVSWQSLDHGVIDDSGRLVGTGSATLRALVTFADGHTQTQDFVYNAYHPVAGTGLSLRIVDSTTFKLNGVHPSADNIAAWLSTDLLAQAPIYSAAVNQLSWINTQPNPVNGKDSLWVYSGELVAPVSGSYQFKLHADDAARLYLGENGGLAATGASWHGDATVTVKLEAGQNYPLWAFYKPSAGGGTNYIELSWKLPGATDFSTVPASALALPPDGMLPASVAYPADFLPFGSTPATGTLSTTQIISEQAFTALSGNIAPVANDQVFSLAQKNLYFAAENLVLTDAIAAQVSSLSIKLDAGQGSAKTIELINLPLTGVTSGATLAQKVQTALNAASGADAANAVSVSYDGVQHKLMVTDAEGRSISNFALGKLAALTPTVLSDAPVVVQAGTEASASNAAHSTIVRVHFAGDAQAATRLAVNLDGVDASSDVRLVDLAHTAIGLGDQNTLASYLQQSIEQRGVTGITVSWDAASQDLVFTDALGRTFTDIKLYTTPVYEPLLALGGDVSQGSLASGSAAAIPSVATLGDLAGQVQAGDANGDALHYQLLEGAKFGSVTLDAGTGKWVYTPTAGGDFHGWDQFTVSVSDGHGGSASPIAVTISDQAAPQAAMPIAHVYAITDPSYVEPVAKGNPVPPDLVFQDVFVAQTHVERPTDPYLVLASDRSVLLKVNVTSASAALAPDLVATVTDKDGHVLGSLRLTGPDHLPTSVDLPSATNIGVQTNADSYVAPLPGAWIQPGIKVTVAAAGSATPLTSFTPNVGADAQLTVRDLALSMFDQNQDGYITGLGSWGQEALSKLPVQSLKLYEYPAIVMDRYGKEQAGNWGVWSGNTSGLPGTDPVFGGGFQSDISYAIHLAGSLKNANFLGSGSGSTMAYVGFTPGAGGGLGGGSIGGGDATAGILWHEFAGHGSGRPHAGTDGSYPYNNLVIDGVTTQGGQFYVSDPAGKATPGSLGPNWGYDQTSGTYLPNYYTSDGTTYLGTDPMWGGSGTAPGHVFQMFSDYYTYLNYQYIAGQTQWVSDPKQNAVDGGFAGDGYFKSWDANKKEWVIWTAANYDQVAGYWRAPVADLPHQADVPVYWLTFSIVDQNGQKAKPGVTYAPDLEVLPVRTLGNLTEPFHDILTGAGRTLDDNSRNGDYVLRVTYSTSKGLITDNLVIPANYGLLYSGINVADKGELVRVDIVEAENANVSAYLNNKVVASYVNSEALANTVFKGDAWFNAEDASLVLPKYWNGSQVTWSASVSGIVDLATGRIDAAKLGANPGAALRAQWVEDGVLHEESFVLKLPETVQTMQTLFGTPTAQAHPDGVQVVSSDRVLPTKLAGATVSWSSSDPAVIDAQGHLLKTGPATLTATVTWTNGAVQQFSENFYAQPPVSFTERTPYVTKELFGSPSEQASIGQKGYLLRDLALPTAVDNGTVTWATSNPSVINAQGQLVGTGAAKLTATVHFSDGLVQTYSQDYYAVKSSSLSTGGLLQRIVDVRDYRVNGADPADTNILAFLTPTVLDRTPLVNQVTSTLDWSKPDGAGANYASYPAGAKDGSGYLIESLWSYSGFVKATTAGTYQFKLIADDSAAIYVQHGDQLVSATTTYQDRADGGKVISVDLAAGEAAPIWVFFKPQAGNSYWGDEVHLTWKAPGDAAFAAIPASQLAATPSTLVSASTGFAQGYLPFAGSDTTSTHGLGLQLRVLDTSNYHYSGSATGLDQYLTADLLGQTPIYSSTGTPDLTVKPVGGGSGAGVPAPLLDASGQVKDSLWVYSGYLVPKASGSYTFSFDADDNGRFYIGSGAQTKSVSSWVNDGDPKTITVELKAGEVVPVWVFFKNQAPGGYWADWVNLKWKLPGDATFTAIPVEQLAPMSDALVPSSGGYPASLLPFDLGAGTTALVGSTQLAGSPAFTALGTPDATQLSKAWNIQAQTSEQIVVSGAEFEQQVSIPTELAGSNMKHWVKLVLRNADGSTSEHDPLGSWTLTTATSSAGATLTVKGTLDSTPGLDVVAIKVYSDDNLLDSTSAAVVSFAVNQGPVGLLVRGHLGDYSIVNGTAAADTLDRSADSAAQAIRGGAGADLIKGGAGNDVIDGGAGDDEVFGGVGNDRLLLSAGTDKLHGQANGATGESNAVVIAVTDLAHAQWSATSEGVRLVSADDDIDLTIANAGVNRLAIQGLWHGNAAQTSADGVQSLQLTDGSTTVELVVGSSAAETLTVNGSVGSSATYLYAEGGDDVIGLGVGKALTADGGAGTDTAQLDWAGLLPDLGGKKLMLVQQPGSSGTYHLSALDADGVATPLLDVVQNGAGANDYTVNLHLNTGAVVSHHLVNVERVQLSPITGYGLTLSAAGVVAVTESSGNDSARILTDHAQTVIAGAGQDSLTIDWSTRMPTLNPAHTGNSGGNTQLTLLSNYAQADATTLATSEHVSGLNLAAATFTMDGGYMAQVSGKAILVDDSVAGQRTFWVAGYDDGYTKAVQLRVKDVAGGISIQALQASYTSGDHTDGSFDFNSAGSSQSIAASDSDAGYGVKAFAGAFAPADFTHIVQTAAGWSLSSGNSALASLKQTATGQNDFDMVLTNVDGSQVTDRLSDVEDLAFAQLGGLSFGLSTDGIIKVMGSYAKDSIDFMNLGSLFIDAGEGVDTVGLTWNEASLPSLAANSLTLSRDTDGDATTSDWHLSAGSVKLLDVTQTNAGLNRYEVKVWNADGSSVKHTVSNAEYLKLVQLDALKSSLAGNAMLTSDADLTLRLKNSVYMASIDGAIATDSGTSATIASGGLTRDNTLGLSGKADAGSTVQIYDGATLLGSATLTGSDWSYTTPVLAEGQHSFTARITDTSGNIATTAALGATIRTYLPVGATTLLTHDATVGNASSSGALTGSSLSAPNGLAVITTGDASQYSNAGTAFVDGAKAQTDLLLANLATGALSLVTHGTASGSSASVAAVSGTTSGTSVTFNSVTPDGKYVIFSNTGDVSSFGNNSGAFTDPNKTASTSDVLAYEVATGKLALLSHTSATGATTSSATNTTYQGISGDGQYVVFSASNLNGSSIGTLTGGAGLVAYKLSDGSLKVVNHTAASLTASAASGSYVGASGDGQYILFKGSDATKFGNGGIAFTDSATGTDDLFAYRLSDGNIRLLTHASGNSAASSGAAVTYAGQSIDDSTIFVTTNDATRFGFTDADTAKADLIAISLTDGSYKLVSHTAAGQTAAGATISAFVKAIGSQVYFTTTDSTALGATSDGDATKTDLWRYDMGTGQTTLISHALGDATAAMNGSFVANSLVTTADQRYVAFTSDLPSGTHDGLSVGVGGNHLFVADTQSGSVVLANHSGSSQSNSTGYQAWGGASAKGFSADGATLVFDNAYLSYFNAGFAKSSDGDRALLAYDVATGNLRLLSHSADSSNKVQGAGATYQGMSADGKWVLFTSNDASKFGNSGKAFTDNSTGSADLFAVHVATGEIRLLSGVDGASTGGTAGFVGFGDDGNTALFTETNVAGLKTAGGTLVDANASGADLVAVRLNLLDLASASDSTGSGAGTAYDNVTASHVLDLGAWVQPNQSAQLYDGDTLVGSATADASGHANWHLDNVASGSHHYTLHDAAEQVPIQLVGSVAASSLDVTVL